MANYLNKDVGFKFAWAIGDDDPLLDPPAEITLMDADKDPQKKWWHVKLKDLGHKPIKVSEGTKIHICVKLIENGTNSEYRHTLFGDYGYSDRLHEIQGQELEFSLARSRHRQEGSNEVFG